MDKIVIPHPRRHRLLLIDPQTGERVIAERAAKRPWHGQTLYRLQFDDTACTVSRPLLKSVIRSGAKLMGRVA